MARKKAKSNYSESGNISSSLSSKPRRATFGMHSENFRGLLYKKSLMHLVSFSRFGSKPGLSRMARLLDLLGSPQNNFKCILVAGTNGKGSTTKFLSDILQSAGYRAGSFYSPHIFSFRERIQVNGKSISKKDFAKSASTVFSSLPLLQLDHPTFFEAITAMAFCHFARKKVDYAVLEVGLGGRLDATNACEPELSIITSVGLEHTDVLGKTVPEIAKEKAGIMRKGKPIICGAVGEAKKEIEKIAKWKRAPIYFIDKNKLKIRLKTLGTYQYSNAAIAATAAQILGIRDEIILKSIQSAKIPARWQTISSSPKIIIDCAHNPQAAEEIANDLKHDFSPNQNSPRLLLFAAMKDKDYSSVLQSILPFFDYAIFCSPPYKRAQSAKNLLACAKKLNSNIKLISISSPDSALKKAKILAGKKGRILVCGSIYLLQYLFGEREFQITG